MLALLDFFKPEPPRNRALRMRDRRLKRPQRIERADNVQLPRMLRRRVAKREDFQLHQQSPRRPNESSLTTALTGAALGANAAGAGADDLVAAAMRADDVHEHVAEHFLYAIRVGVPVAAYVRLTFVRSMARNDVD